MPATTAKGYPYPLGTDRVMDGDDSIHNLATEVDTALGRACVGVTTVNLPTAGAVGSVAVTFPVGRFTAPPQVGVSIATGVASYLTGTAVGVTGQTTGGMTLNAVRSGGNTAIGVSWVAVQN